MNFKEYINENKIPKEFDWSEDATEYMENILEMLRTKALVDWAKETDKNFGAKTSALLKKAQASYEQFLDAMHEAGQ